MIINLIRILLQPKCWVRNYSTSKFWDMRLSYMLDHNPEIIKVGKHTHIINGIEIWTENYPYCYGERYSNMLFPKETKRLPSRSTVFRLKEILDDFDIQQKM